MADRDDRSRLPLSERLRPERLADLVGNAPARNDLRAWAERWKEGVPSSFRAVLLVGPPGVGKTTAAAAVAREFGWAYVEMNASDARNQGAIEQVAGRASISQGLDAAGPGGRAGRALILLDEADCLSGRATESARAAAEPPSLKEFLQRRYQHVEALNRAWGLEGAPKAKPFPDWASVPRSPGRHGWATLPVAQRDLDDWRSSQKTSDVSDRGGLAAIARLVRTTRQPVVLTVNDERPLTRYSPVFRTSVRRIRFLPIRDAELSSRLVEIVRSEKIELASGVLEAIVGRSRGDLRAALNDLEAVGPLPPGPAQREVLGSRDLSADFASFTTEAFSRPRYYRSVEVSDRLDAPPDELLPWIEENLDRFSDDPRHRAGAFDVLGVAERFLARARRARVWSQWSYASELLSGGVPLAARERSGGLGPVAQFPQFLIEMGRSRGYRGLRAGVAAKLGRRLHVGTRKATVLLLPFLEALLEALVHAPPSSAERRAAQRLVRELELTAEEVTFLLGDAADATVVEALVAPPDAPPAEAEEASATPSTGEMPSGAPSSRRGVQRSLSEFGRG